MSVDNQERTDPGKTTQEHGKFRQKRELSTVQKIGLWGAGIGLAGAGGFGIKEALDNDGGETRFGDRPDSQPELIEDDIVAEPVPNEGGEAVDYDYETRQVGETFSINDREMTVHEPIRNVDDWIIDAVNNSTAPIVEYTPPSPGSEYVAIPVESHREVGSDRTLIDDMAIEFMDGDELIEPIWRLSPDGRVQLHLQIDNDFDPNNQIMHYVYEVPSDSKETGELSITQNFLNPDSEPFTDVRVELGGANEGASEEKAPEAEVEKETELLGWHVGTSGELVRGEEANEKVEEMLGEFPQLDPGYEFAIIRVNAVNPDGAASGTDFFENVNPQLIDNKTRNQIGHENRGLIPHYEYASPEQPDVDQSRDVVLILDSEMIKGDIDPILLIQAIDGEHATFPVEL